MSFRAEHHLQDFLLPFTVPIKQTHFSTGKKELKNSQNQLCYRVQGKKNKHNNTTHAREMKAS